MPICRGLAAASLLAWAVGSGCAEPSGIVELDWSFVDSQGEAIFPGGKILETPDTCSLAGRDAQGSRDYQLQVRLVVRDQACEETLDEAGGESGGESGGGVDTSACEVASEFFGCDRARGALTEVPPSGDLPYVLDVEVWATPRGETAPAFQVRPQCIAVPGPRARKVQAGRITDLAVYQLVAYGIDLDDASAGGLDLVGCRPPT